MPNKDLKNRTWVVPKNIIFNISNILKNYRGNTDELGVKRAKNIIENPNISYSEMKRLKNFFDNANDNTFEYNVIGGKTMKDWVNNSLKTSRDTIYNEKKTRMMTGEENQFIKTHEKDKIVHPKNDKRNPITKINTTKLHKQLDSKNMMLDNSFTEEIKRIKTIIEQIDK